MSEQIRKAVNYWLKSAKRDQEAANDLLKLKHYHWCLFMWHLVIEKVLKAIIAARNNEHLPIHDLVQLSKRAGLELSQDKIEMLAEATSFNLEARYDSYKRDFYKKATKEYTKKWAGRLDSLYQWLLKQL
ncbi:HEPN domain-containing protein [Patescibacteria group bacterium]|nr:HEPN domain-containing protein [Patescibacteria group bacterium]